MTVLEEISFYLQRGRTKNVKELVGQALDAGIAPQEILDHGLLAGMSAIGERFRKHEVFVPEVLVSARAMNAGTALLQPKLVQERRKPKGKVVIGTVRGDLHDIGKNLVKMMMEARGLTVIDLGVDVPAADFADAAIKNHAQIVCCSSLLTTTMSEIRSVIEACVARGIRDQVKIMIGGAPLDQEFCDFVGADCYTEDASSAAAAALNYVT